MPTELVSQSTPKSVQTVFGLCARLALPGTVLVALLAELALAERKFAIFGGGFGQSQTLDTAGEIAAFLIVLLVCQAAIFYGAFRLVRRLHGARADTPLFYFNFVFLGLLVWVGALVAKYQALAYFSDAMSFQIVRNLGGGSLLDALLFSMSEAGLILLSAGGALLVYLLACRLLVRRWRDLAPAPDRTRIPPRLFVLLLLIAPLLLFAANRIDDTRSALARFNAIFLWSAPLGQITDFDRDGWSLFSHPIDLQPFDPARHPYALDIPGNGIDEDGFGGDLAFREPPEIATPVIDGARPHVILIVLESARADAIGHRIDGRSITPVIDGLVARGSSAPAAYSHVGFTTFSLKSLFTGRLDPASGAPSLVDDFLANGYEVGVFSAQAEDFGDIATVTGMRRGRYFVDANTQREERAFSFAAEGSLYIDGRIVLREFREQLGDPAQWDTPHFLYFNFQSAHFPYFAPGTDRIVEDDPIPRGEISAANRDWLQRTYWNAIAYNDRLVGELVAELQRLGVYENSLIVITADHGESLFDDGFLGHGHMLSAEQTQIPFILSAPGVALDGPVGLADMRPIVLRAAGADIVPPSPQPVFQYLGTLDRPGKIGTVDAAGRWTVFDLNREAVRTGDGPWRRYGELTDGSAERRSADDLIDRWASERWLGLLQRREQRAGR